MFSLQLKNPTIPKRNLGCFLAADRLGYKVTPPPPNSDNMQWQWQYALLVQRGKKYMCCYCKLTGSNGGCIGISNVKTQYTVTKLQGFFFSGWTTWWATVRWWKVSEDHQGQRSSPNWAPCPRSPWHTGKWCGHWRIYHSRRCYGSPSWSTL